MSQTSQSKPDATKAVVIFVGDRYFSRFGYQGRLQTSWSLAGAKLFGTWERDAVAKTLRRIRAKGHEALGFKFVAVRPFDPNEVGPFLCDENAKASK